MRPLVAQLLATFAAGASTFGWGCAIGLSAVIIPQLRDEENGLAWDDTDISWFGSLLPVGAIAGSLIPALILKRCGCKYPLLAFTILYIVGFTLIALATPDTAVMAHVGRTVTGIAVGGSTPIAFVYIPEISDPAWRGQLGSFMITLLTIGITFIMSIGVFVTWQITCLLCIIPMVIGVVLMSFVCESPYHLAAVGRHSDAKRAMAWFNGGDDQVAEQKMKDVQDYLNQKEQMPSIKAVISGWFTKPRLETTESAKEETMDNIQEGGSATLKAVAILLCIFAFSRLTGISPVSFYGLDIFTEKLRLPLAKEVLSPLMGAAEVVGSAFTLYLIDKTGRRVLLVVSGFGIGVAHFLTSASFYFIEDQDFDCEATSVVCYLPVVGTGLFYIFFAFGYGAIPNVVQGEILPHSTKGPAISIINVFQWVVNSVIAKVFYDMSASLGYSGTYLFYSVSSVLGAILVLVFLPETKNQTLADIQRKLTGKKLEVTLHQSTKLSGDEEDKGSSLLANKELDA